ncbi:flagellin [Clostridium beijerinckii]|jgi:Flagellin and related hook-associated proteins|uniref:Flagellin n=2 Tax=Clostridium beijerinckii TaxID=1520 RepID=A0AAE2RQW0_CLOBE|nr:flagellin [Clostridium beijerinckii]ABR36399.1 flagellin domain protein [Clostridium beijerinckii NCIMB 8052]AIU02279.1 flagellin domain-containing protein [Clostridium beijerinckii ATCC 35702]MBF7808954.1 flagellin [Clostridium beijerinckii]NRT22535.1 flagellin [Clostridium beijerinckii]NRT64949.1 flagellin [Clostridium beijerinckii]
MVINHNLSAMNAHRQMGINTNASSKAVEKLSSGQRINRAGDDAAGLAISEKMRSQIRGLNQGSTNAQDGISLVQTAEGALTETHSMLQRLKTLATQSANGTNQNSDRDLIQKEVDQLTSEVSRIATQTEFNGKNILNTSNSVAFQVGNKSGQEIKIVMQTMTATKLAVNSLKLDTATNAKAALAKIESAITEVSKHRATLGAVQNRLEHTITSTDNTSENLQAAESRIRDTDMAKEMMEYTKDNVLTQAAQSMLAQANQTPNNVLKLLQ